EPPDLCPQIPSGTDLSRAERTRAQDPRAQGARLPDEPDRRQDRPRARPSVDASRLPPDTAGPAEPVDQLRTSHALEEGLWNLAHRDPEGGNRDSSEHRGRRTRNPPHRAPEDIRAVF